MKRLLLFLCILSQSGFSQNTHLDSLKSDLLGLALKKEGSVKDSLRGQAIIAIMKVYENLNVDSSLHYNSLLINLYTTKHLQKDLIYAYQYAGYLSQIKGDHHQSIRFHYKALGLAEKFNQYSRIAVSCGALAHAYTSLKYYNKARQLCQKGLSVLIKHPDNNIQLSILNVLGSIYREQGKLNDALKVNTKMYELARVEGDLWYESYGLHAVGRVFNDMGNISKALEYYQKALSLSRKANSIELEGNILLNTADLYIKQKEWKKALAYASSAKQMAASIKNSSVISEAEEKLYIIFKNTGQAARALKAYESFISLRDIMSREKNQQRIETLQAQYDNVQKTNALQSEKVKRLNGEMRNQQLSRTTTGLFFGILAIILVAFILFWNNRQLQLKNQEIDSQKSLLEIARKKVVEMNKTLEIRVAERTEELVLANKELIRKNEEIKGALFKGQTIERKRVALELHDNLSSLLSAVNMTIQSINPQNLSQSEQSVYHNLKYLIQSAYAEVRNISHNILPSELEKEGLIKTLSTLINQLNQNSELQFSLSAIGLDERLPVEIEFNVYSIVWELINNAIRHAQATTVSITFSRNELGMTLIVCDDGIGLRTNTNKRGIGLQNIQTRLDSLGGAIDTSSMLIEKGTQIIIYIPIETVHFNGNVLTASPES